MQKYEIEKLRSLPCEGVAQRLGLTVKHHKALCPFHDDHTPSLTFKKNKFRCWSCGASGDSISLVEEMLGKDFLDACRWLADEHQVIIDEWKPPTVAAERPRAFDASRYEPFFSRPWLSDEARRFLFQERGIDPRVVSWCRLTSFRDRRGTPWLQTPYYNMQGELTGVQSRNLAPGGSPRFLFPQASVCTIYNQPVLNRLRPGDELWITEGCSDCWAMLSSGCKAIAIPSATLLGRKDVQLLTRLADSHGLTFHMYPDRDEPGERLFLQLRQVLPSLEHHQLPPGCKDFGEYFARSKL